MGKPTAGESNAVRRQRESLDRSYRYEEIVKSPFYFAITIALIVGCAGCAHGVKEDRAPTQAFTLEEWSNRVTSSGLDVDSVVYPFGVTPAMEAWIEEVFRGGGSLTEPERLEVLQRALFDRGFDFFLTSEEPFVRQHVVDDVQATAMYHNNMGGMAIRDGDLKGAKKTLEVTTAIAPDWPPGWINLGVARSRSGDIQGALEAYGVALGLAPDHPSALANLAYVYRQLGFESEATTLLQAAAGGSNHPFTLIALADSEMLRGDYDAASGLLRQARKKDRQAPEVWDAMARLARHQNDPSKADRFRAKAEKLRMKQAKQEAVRTPRPGFPIDSQLPPRGPR